MAFLHLAVLFLATLGVASPVKPRVPTLPDSKTFKAQNGTKWHIKYVGDIKFTGSLGAQNIHGDNCRSSFISGRHIWTCGDMMCKGGVGTCGIADGPAFYGTNDVMTIDSSAHSFAPDFTFVQPWAGDPKPVAPENCYGHGTSNTVQINSTHGLAVSWVYTRGYAADGTESTSNIGNTIVAVSMAKDRPIATRLGPAFTDGNAITMAAHSIIKVGGYIYMYTAPPSKLPGPMIVGRVKASFAAANDASQYEYLKMGTACKGNSKPVWLKGVPSVANAATYGMTAADGYFMCQVFGSIFWNNYFQKYMIMCNTFMWDAWFLLSDTPYGPWSTNYNLFSGIQGYGINVHPIYSPKQNHKTLYFSQSPNDNFTTFKVDFAY